MHLRPISEIMTAHVIAVTREAPVLEALRIIDTQRLSCVVVVEGPRPVGIFTEWDAVTLLARSPQVSHQRVDEVMQPPLLIGAEVDVREAYQGMVEAETLQAIVVDEAGHLRGLVTEGDLLHFIDTAQLAELKPVSRVMLRDPLELPPDASLAQAAQGMTARQSGTVLVTVDHRPVGILTERDMVHLIREGRTASSTRLIDVMSRPVQTISEHAPLREAGHRMEEAGIRRLAVVDGEGRLIGLLTRHEVVRTLQGRYLEFLRDMLKQQGKDLSRTRQKLEETRRELIYRSVIAQVNDAVMVIDVATGRLIETNDHADTLLGYARESLLQRHAWDICASIGGAEGWASFAQDLFQAGTRLLESTLRDRDGTLIPVETSLRYVASTDGRYVVALARDIRERRQAEERLRRSEAQLREAQHIAHVGSWELDHHAGQLIWSDEVFRIFEIEHTAFGADYPAFLARVHPDDRQLVDQAFQQHLTTRAPYDIVHRLCFADGRIKHVREQCETSFDAHGLPLRSVGTVHDITLIKETENRLRETQDMLRLVINTIPHAVFWKDRDSRYLGGNESFARSAGLRCAEDLVGKRDEDLAWREQAEFYQRDDAQIMASGTARYNYAEPQTTPDGRLIWLETSKVPLRDAQGKVFGVLGIYQDVSERHLGEAKLRQAAAVFENTREGVIITDAKGQIVAVNRAFTEITQYAPEEVLGHSPSLLKSGRHGQDFYQSLWNTLRAQGHWQGEIWNRRKDGELYPELLTISSVLDDEGGVTHYVAVFADISQLKRSEEQLTQLAHYDQLTGLPNRLLLQSRLDHSLDRAYREQRKVAVMFLDLDRFKNVNDSLGHPAGDELLTLIAHRLQGRLREEDTLARLGGDEFVLVLEDLRNPDEAARIALEIIELLSQGPFRLGSGHEVYIGASIGISFYPGDGQDPMELIRNADAAMYQAKMAGRNTYRFYTEELTRKAQQRLSLETRLRQALETDELTVFYQPQIDLASGRMVGMEALARWRHPDEGLISPAQFIPLAEESGLIVPLGEQVLRKAMTQARSWHLGGHAGLRMAVNLSSRQFQQPDLSGQLLALLEETGLDPGCLELEITESMLLEQGPGALRTLERIRSLGISLSIDDFGTGYSSLSYLKRLPVHKLKIDQSFVRGIPDDPRDMEIAATIIAMARNLRLEVLAEGVETEAQLAYLRSRGCDMAQGYYFSPPVPAEQLGPMLAAGGLLLPAMEDALSRCPAGAE
ncbi:MAG: EAL domain-containing protein [Pseudomonadota bacterium]